LEEEIGYGEKLSFTVGTTYIVASFFGIGVGLVKGYPKNWKNPKKLIFHNLFNHVGSY